MAGHGDTDLPAATTRYIFGASVIIGPAAHQATQKVKHYYRYSLCAYA